ncbi:MAG: exodeoxyribonuclease VII small subunit [Clostridia bacterium]|nr:exodeoxyribonuclease VII small subunit [Clostridia bacterium]
MNFEENLKKIEEIVSEIETGNLDLDDTIKKFEEGMELSKKCSKFLEDAEKKITILVKNEDEIKEEKFNIE